MNWADIIPDPISATFGGVLILFGWLLQLPHRRAWQREQVEFANDPRELRHHQARFRRRSLTSGLIGLVGLLIVVLDLPIVWKVCGPIGATILWCLVILLCAWIGLLAVGDFATTRAHNRANLARLHTQKQELLGQLESMRPAPPAPAAEPRDETTAAKTPPLDSSLR